MVAVARGGRAGSGHACDSSPAARRRKNPSGWTEPRGEAHGPLVESVGGQWLLEFMVESKTLPASVVRRKVDERAAQIEVHDRPQAGQEGKEGTQGRRHARTAAARLHAPCAHRGMDRSGADRRLVVNASNLSRARTKSSTSLVKALDGFALAQINTQMEPAAAMSEWLVHAGAARGFHHRPRMRTQGDRRVEGGGALRQASRWTSKRCASTSPTASGPHAWR